MTPTASTTQKPLPLAPPLLEMSPAVRRGFVAGPKAVEDSLGADKSGTVVTRWAADGRCALTENDKGLAVRDLSGRVLARPKLGRYDGHVLGISGDGMRLFATTLSNVVCTNVSTGERNEVCANGPGSMSLARGAVLAAFIHTDEQAWPIKVYDGSLSEALRTIEHPYARALWLSPDGRNVAAHRDGELSFIDVDTGAVRGKIEAERYCFNLEVVFADAAPRALVRVDKQYQVVDLENGKTLHSAPCGGGSDHKLAISPRGDRIVTTLERAYVITDLGDGRIITLPFAASGTLDEVRFTPDGDVVLVRPLDPDGMHVQAYSAHTGKFLWRHMQRNGWSRSMSSQLSLSPDGTRLSVGNKCLIFGDKPTRRGRVEQSNWSGRKPERAPVAPVARQLVERLVESSKDEPRTEALMWRYLCRGAGGSDDAAVLQRGAELLTAICRHTSGSTRAALTQRLTRLTGNRVPRFAAAGRIVKEMCAVQSHTLPLADTLHSLYGTTILPDYFANLEGYLRNGQWDAILTFQLASKLTPAMQAAWFRFADEGGAGFMRKLAARARVGGTDSKWHCRDPLSEANKARIPNTQRLCKAADLHHEAWLYDLTQHFSDADIATAARFYESQEGRALKQALAHVPDYRFYQNAEDKAELARIDAVFYVSCVQ